MKANELRMGCFVNYELNRSIKQGVVRTINNDSCNITAIFDSSPINTVKFKSLLPIPLTEKWFIKFGFEKKTIIIRHGINEGIDKYCMDGNVFIKDITGKWFLSAYIWNHKHLEYVHQLQNLYFALTGEELTIK